MPIALSSFESWATSVRALALRTLAFGTVVYGTLVYGTLASSCASNPNAAPPNLEPSAPEQTTTRPLEIMPAEDVAFGLRHKENDARRCFSDFERSESTFHGLVRMQWTVAPSGSVDDATIQRSTIEHEGVTNCLTRFVEGLKYPQRARAGRADWTFVRGVGDASVLERAEKRRKLAKGRHAKHEPGRSEGARVDERSLGELPTNRIESVAEAGFRIYAHCLRSGLDRNIKLRGRVLLRFTIGDDGRVLRVADAGSDLPDLDVIDCVAQGFYALEFPPPSGGIVSVTYPIFLNEGD